MGVIYTTEQLDTWQDGLRDTRRAEEGNFGDCEPVGESVSQMRIHHGPG